MSRSIGIYKVRSAESKNGGSRVEGAKRDAERLLKAVRPQASNQPR